MGLIQSNYRNNNFTSKKNLDYSHIRILTILPTHTRKLTSPFSISQLPQNTYENSFNHFIEHLMGVRENSKFEPQQVRLRPK